jgi:hypothetical protein
VVTETAQTVVACTEELSSFQSKSGRDDLNRPSNQAGCRYSRTICGN